MSGQALGFALAALQYGYQSKIPAQQRKLGGLTGYVTFSETHSDELDITEHPIEQGAAISDHAYKRPAEVTLKVGWSNSPGGQGLLGGARGLFNTANIAASNLLGTSTNQVIDIYQKLLDLQQMRKPFDLFTGKRFYRNMLIKSLVVVTDKDNENILSVTASLKQVILVTTTTLMIEKVPPEAQQLPGTTQPPVSMGSKQLLPALKINLPAATLAITPR